MTLKSRLDLLAERGVVTRDRLLAAGFTREAIWHARDSRRLFERHPGVYAVGRPELTREGEWLAAVLACGPGAVLSHLDAAAHLEVLDRADRSPHVTVPTQAGVATPRGVVLHRSDTLAPADCTTWRGIPVTTAQRTLLDIALRVQRRALREAVRQAERLHGIDLLALDAAVQEPRTSPKHARLRKVLERYVPRESLTDSEFEARFLELCARSRLPAPTPQLRIGHVRADFAFERERVVVETDGRGTHQLWTVQVADRQKDRFLASQGWEVMRFTWAEVVNLGPQVARELRAALKRRRIEVQSSMQGYDPAISTGPRVGRARGRR